MIDRSTFLAAAAGTAALALAPRIARADEPVRVMTLPIDQGAQSYYAADLGMFKKAGLDVVVSTTNFGTQVAAAVAGGSIEIGQSNIMSLAAAYANGLPFALIAGAGLYSSAKPTSMLIVGKNSPLQTAKDLNGKTVAVNGLKSITQISVQAWADKNGGDSSQIKFVEMPFVEMEGALTSGRIDAALLADPNATLLLAGGHTRAFTKAFDAIGKQFLIGGWFAKTDWIAANADTVHKFIAVMRESAQWANKPANYKQSAAILEKYTSVSVGASNRIVYAERLDPALIQPSIDTAAKYGLLKAAFPAAKLISNVAA
jgi:NitT/TauT family transport system substrate-binding protein